MKILKAFDSMNRPTKKTARPANNPLAKGKGIQKRAKQERPPRLNISASELRAKVNNHFRPKGSVEGPDAGRVFSPEEAAQKLSNVSLNDPNDPMVKEKLKGALNAGMVNFSDAQREVLSSILKK